ncbi:GHMP kinase [Magnetococcus marinus MC-1]|uniref:GHMP kinase n=1 Tax=Magnetococcus marinus (strain ATCC BAA-1437 / JCM 17883 / MC-1) TaxID=156889 RepID=A0L595_MAGMM|nr:kinase [Magnetococcus marinus]ABK43138.1 GHMP kinase [Magnetococcus marinus MC-1]
MIITRTPFRISFFGGGTDYPAWAEAHGGAVLATAINKYCYISIRELPPFFEHKYRIAYSRLEHVREIDEIQHPVVREGLRKYAMQHGLEIHHDADLPARSGLGSSSSFAAGFLKALHAFEGRMITKLELAKEAIDLEQNLIGENVGSQDQILATYGGLNKVEFLQNGSFNVIPVILPRARIAAFEQSLLLVFTGLTRIASDVAKQKIANLHKRSTQLHSMRAMVDEGLSILNDSKQPIDRLGTLLHENWQLKRTLSDVVSNPHIDEIYAEAMAAGATGGKLMGAGSGGFMVFVVKPERREQVKKRLHKLIHVNCAIDNDGSQVIVYEPQTGYR